MAAVLAAVSVACGGPSASQSPDELKTLVVGAAQEPPTLDPLIRQGPDTDLVIWSVNEGLVEFDAEGKLYPELAESLPKQLDDGLRWQVKLRTGVKFSDGTAFDANVVKKNIDTMLLPENAEKSAVYSEMKTLKGVEVVDDHTVNFVTSSPDSFFDLKLSFFRVVSPKSIDGGDIASNPAGTGPFMLDAWNRGQEITLKQNPNWRGDKPQVETVTIRYIPDAATRIAALNRGEIDLAEGIPVLDAKNVPKALRSPDVLKTQLLRLNLTVPPLNDPNFRKALNYAIDKKSINDKIYGGQYVVAPCQAVGEKSAGYTPDVSAYDYDPQKAKDLLAKVNIPPGFALTMTSKRPPTRPGDDEMMQVIAQNLNAVGVKTEVKFLRDADSSAANNASAGDGKVKPGTPDAHLMAPDNGWNNSIRWINNYVDRNGRTSGLGTAEPQLDQTIVTANSSRDKGERDTALADIATTSCDDALFVYLLAYADLWGAVKGIQYEPVFGVLNQFHFENVTFK